MLALYRIKCLSIHYFGEEKSKVKRKRAEFENDPDWHDPVNGKHIPFTKILDKGYRVTLPAWQAGRQ